MDIFNGSEDKTFLHLITDILIIPLLMAISFIISYLFDYNHSLRKTQKNLNQFALI